MLLRVHVHGRNDNSYSLLKRGVRDLGRDERGYKRSKETLGAFGACPIREGEKERGWV